MTIDRFPGFGCFAGIPRWAETDDEVLAFCHTDSFQRALVNEALQEIAELEMEIEELDDMVELLDDLHNRPLFASQDDERTIRARTQARIIMREGKYCARCKFRLGVELHEIVTRQRIRGNWRARQEVFSHPELCALTCRECHPSGRDESNNWWMAYKIEVYGLDRVLKALARVNRHLVNPVDLAEFKPKL